MLMIVNVNNPDSNNHDPPIVYYVTNFSGDWYVCVCVFVQYDSCRCGRKTATMLRTGSPFTTDGGSYGESYRSR